MYLLNHPAWKCILNLAFCTYGISVTFVGWHASSWSATLMFVLSCCITGSGCEAGSGCDAGSCCVTGSGCDVVGDWVVVGFDVELNHDIYANYYRLLTSI